MKLLKKSLPEALGLHIDGDRIRVAHLRRTPQGIALVKVDSLALKNRMDAATEESDTSTSTDAEDILGLEPAASSLDADAQDEKNDRDNTEVFYELLSQFPIKQCKLAFSLLESSVFYTDCPAADQLSAKALKEKLLEEAQKEWSNYTQSVPLQERHDFIKVDDTRLVSIVHEDPLDTLQVLEDLKPFIGEVKINLIDPLEITLMNLVRQSYPDDPKVTAVIYVGEDFGRVVFMQNGHYLAVSQPVYEKAGGDRIVQTVCSRLLLEQDMSELPAIDRVLLAGPGCPLSTQTLVETNFPGVDVSLLKLPAIGTDALAEEEQNLLASYAVPIGLAWKALSPKNDRLYPSNFLPTARKRRQNPLALAWHTVALMGLLAVSSLLVGMEVKNKMDQIRQQELGITLLEEHIEETRPYVTLVENLHQQISRYEQDLALVDTLATRQTHLSQPLRALARAAAQTGNLWFHRVSTSTANISIQGAQNREATHRPTALHVAGYALYRNRLTRLANRFDDEHIRSVVRTDIRGKTVHEFDLVLPLTHQAQER